MRRMSRYIISTLLVLIAFSGYSQGKSIDLNPKDTLVYKQPYGLRIGIDLSRPLTSFFNDDYTGLEFVGDYRLSQKLYVAGEVGNEKKTKQEDVYNFTTSGSYIKAGIDYNTYGNWYGEQNMITVGGRYAFGSFSQTVNNYQIYDTERYWSPEGFVSGSTTAEEFGGLTASWLEAVVGVKMELFKNMYLGGSVRIGLLITNKESERFPNLFIPGFNKVTDGSKFGVGYNYTLTYLVPLYNKAKKAEKIVEPVSEE